MTATFMPAAGTPTTTHVLVALVDRDGRLDRLTAYLPRRWTTRRYASLYAARGCDLIVLADATAELVAEARLIHPSAPVVTVIDANAPNEALVAILEAGADACVRAGAPAVVAGHLLSCHRRQRQFGTRPRPAGVA